MATDVIQWLESVQPEQKRKDCQALIKLMTEVTGEPPKLWGTGIIGFGQYHYKYKNGRELDWFLIGFAPRKKNLALYIMPGCDGYDDFMQQLSQQKTDSSCLYINKWAETDLVLLRTFMEASVKYLKESSEKTSDFLPE